MNAEVNNLIKIDIVTIYKSFRYLVKDLFTPKTFYYEKANFNLVGSTN